MKMILIAYNEGIDDDLMVELTGCGVDCFTKWQRVLGKGILSEPHLNSAVWPGANNVLMLVVEDIKCKAIIGKVKDLRKTLGKEGIKAFVLPVDEVA